MSLSTSDIALGSIFSVQPPDFDSLALEVFRFQYSYNKLYRNFCDALQVKVDDVSGTHSIPFLPVGFFKSKEIKTTEFETSLVFKSSGTTGSDHSSHFVKDALIYETSFTKNFTFVYGDITRYCIIGLLPSYLEKTDSSLVYMVNELIKSSANTNSGFYLYDHEKLHSLLQENEKKGQPTILIGVTFALLDFADVFQMKLKHTLVMETGGMKGRKKEITREEVHAQLKQRLGLDEVHSEYGMTELLSQAYATKDGIYSPPPWMKMMVRAEDDPLQVIAGEESIKITGGGNIIDLANIYSCAFIATDDLVRLHPDGKFEILGRLENSDIRGCGLMI